MKGQRENESTTSTVEQDEELVVCPTCGEDCVAVCEVCGGDYCGDCNYEHCSVEVNEVSLAPWGFRVFRPEII